MRVRRSVGKQKREAELLGKKYCPDCDSALDLYKFGKNRRNPGGLATYCKGCMRHRVKIAQRVAAGWDQSEPWVDKRLVPGGCKPKFWKIRSCKRCGRCLGPVGSSRHNCAKCKIVARVERLAKKVARKLARRHNDPEYAKLMREKRNAHRKTPRGKKTANARRKVRMASEPAFRAKHNANKAKRKRVRVAEDPAYAEHVRIKANEHKSRHEARKRGAEIGDPFTRIDVFVKNGGICYLCDKPVSEDCFHVEHAIPLSRGGAHSLDNCWPSHPECNLAKCDMTPMEYWMLSPMCA